MKDVKMDSSALIATWNTLRNTIIKSQMSSVIILAIALYLVATGEFANATAQVKLFAVAVVVTTGALSLINQFAAIREGSALIKDMKESGSALETSIASSARFVGLTQAALAMSALATLVLFVVAIYS
jgi:hypothetical protein